MDPFEKLRAHIRTHYPSEAAFAGEVAISPAALSRYLNGKRRPRDDIRRRIWERAKIDLNPVPPAAAPVSGTGGGREAAE